MEIFKKMQLHTSTKSDIVPVLDETEVNKICVNIGIPSFYFH